MENKHFMQYDNTSLFRSLGGQRRGPGANYSKKSGQVVVFFTVYWRFYLVARCRVNLQVFGAIWAPLQLTEISRTVAEESNAIVV